MLDSSQDPGVPGAAGGAPAFTAPPLSKAEALRRLGGLKKGVTVAAVLGFGVFGGLAARHNAGAATPAASPTTPASQPSGSGPAQAQQSQPPDNGWQQYQSPDDSQQNQQYPPNQSQQGGFFNQGQGGYGFGNGGSAQAPVAGSGAS